LGSSRTAHDVLCTGFGTIEGLRTVVSRTSCAEPAVRSRQSAIFTLAFIVLVILAIANLGGTASRTSDVAKVGGWFGLLDSFAAGYLGAALVINVSTGKSLLPLFPTKLWKS
jgi:succinate-acetate transporter protein